MPASGVGVVLCRPWRCGSVPVLCLGAGAGAASCGGLWAAGLGVNNCVAGFQSVDSRGTITCFCGSCQAYFFGVNVHAVGASGGVTIRSVRNTFCAGCFLVGGGGLVAVLARAVRHCRRRGGSPVEVVFWSGLRKCGCTFASLYASFLVAAISGVGWRRCFRIIRANFICNDVSWREIGGVDNVFTMFYPMWHENGFIWQRDHEPHNETKGEQ